MSKNLLKQKLNFQQTFTKLQELEKNKSYLIINGEFKKTKHGEAILVTLEGNLNVYLPSRFTKLITKKDLSEMIGMKLIYKGMKTYDGKDMHDVEFD